MIRIELQLQRGNFALHANLDTQARVSGLFGPSGSGKTTFLHALAGLIRPERGRIEIDGEVLFDSNTGRWTPPERRRVGVVFQDGRLFPHIDVRANLLASRPEPGTPGPGLQDVVSLLDLETLLGRMPESLSGGEQRRVAIGRALLYRPRLLLLDEPLTGLDEARQRRILAYLMRLSDVLDVRMLMVSHVYAHLMALVGEVGLMDAGRVTATGPPELLLERAIGAGDEPVETTLRGEVTATGDTATVRSQGTEFHLPLSGAAGGRTAFVTIPARDVLLAVGDPPTTSARNCLPGTVTDLRRSGGRVLVQIDAGPRFWVEVTENAVRDLKLEPGREVLALIKATALRGVVLENQDAQDSPRPGLALEYPGP